MSRQAGMSPCSVYRDNNLDAVVAQVKERTADGEWRAG